MMHKARAMSASDQLSIVIPVREGEPLIDTLLADLEQAAPDAEILVRSCGTRAASLNAGAKDASREILWFLHADCRVERRQVAGLLSAVRHVPDALFFFDLDFGPQIPMPLRWNQWFANRRARLLRLPFGDQGLACTRETFKRIGEYPEDAAYGEDHLFVWQAHLAGIAVRPLDLPLPTSPRSYAAHGWLRLTVLYQWRWLRQALPRVLALAAGRRRNGMVRHLT
ncbi:MAG: hypothetical protein D6757_05230 [Alphaproteobacteria bacterium]|nr:MAG: hypothetical protein D6757_05230 [Alphaproteobacteria bacterium]